MSAIRTMLAGVLLSFSAFGQGAVGKLSGSITDLQGNPLAGAVMSYQRVYLTVSVGGQLMPAPGEAVAAGSVVADPTGAFSLTSLPIGDYLLCASVPDAPYLDPCSWNQAVGVTVSSAAVSQQTISLAKGVFLNVRINDLMGLLPKSVDGAFGGGPIVGVIFGSGAWLNAQNTSVDSTGRDYQMPIPAGTPLNLWLFSSKVVLMDSGGNTVPKSGLELPFHAVAAVDQAFTFTVSGPIVVSQSRRATLH